MEILGCPLPTDLPEPLWKALEYWFCNALSDYGLIWYATRPSSENLAWALCLVERAEAFRSLSDFALIPRH
ncbi:MAG: hypothetical protein MI920_03350 [Kiloniellales bacterium]|nr:hypothetical protein [Kiloniellales bacterium]